MRRLHNLDLPNLFSEMPAGESPEVSKMNILQQVGIEESQSIRGGLSSSEDSLSVQTENLAFVIV